MGLFKKCQEKSKNLTKFEKFLKLSVYIYKIFYVPKPSNGIKLIRNFLKSD